MASAVYISRTYSTLLLVVAVFVLCGYSNLPGHGTWASIYASLCFVILVVLIPPLFVSIFTAFGVIVLVSNEKYLVGVTDWMQNERVALMAVALLLVVSNASRAYPIWDKKDELQSIGPLYFWAAVPATMILSILVYAAEAKTWIVLGLPAAALAWQFFWAITLDLKGKTYLPAGPSATGPEKAIDV